MTDSSTTREANNRFIRDKTFFLGWTFDLSDESNLLNGVMLHDRNCAEIWRMSGLTTNGTQAYKIFERVVLSVKAPQPTKAKEREEQEEKAEEEKWEKLRGKFWERSSSSF